MANIHYINIAAAPALVTFWLHIISRADLPAHILTRDLNNLNFG